jgi:uncharacterized protein (TIGR02118 family)
MVKFILYFRQPADVDAFEDHFANRHVPLIAAMPNVVRSSVTRALGAPRGEPIFYLIHEVYFQDLSSMTYALNSAQGRAAGADVMLFARDVVTLMFGEVWGEDPFEMMGSEPAPTSASETENQTQTPDAHTNAATDKVPIDVSFLEKEKPREPVKVMTVEEAILGPDYKPPAASEPEAVAVAVAESETETETAAQTADAVAATESPIPEPQSPSPDAAIPTDTPAPEAPRPPRPSLGETLA